MILVISKPFCLMDGQASTINFKVRQPSLQGSSLKRSSPSIFGQPKAKVARSKGTGRTKQDFLDFCLAVLEYAEYQPEETEEEPRAGQPYKTHDMSGMASDGLGGTSDSSSSNSAHRYDGSSAAAAVCSSSACSSEEDEVITCFCNKPFANRAMIQCGSCERWIHFSCAKVRRSHIPEVYICIKCREPSRTARKSGRPRMEKKFVDDV